MGVSIVGFAAFRNEEGKLCRFEYGYLSMVCLFAKMSPMQVQHSGF